MTLRGSDTEPYQCVICKSRPAVRGAGFQSIPISSKDDQNSSNLCYYKAMLQMYSEAGAFPAETFEDVWKQFDGQRADTAQMASLTIPVCEQEICIQSTTGLHQKSIMKIVSDTGRSINLSGLFLTTLF